MTAAVPAPPPLDDGLEQLLRRMRLPHMRRIAPEVIATAKAQRWDPAEVLRTLLAEEVAGRDKSSLATRRARAAFPTGKTFDAWDEHLSSVPAPTQAALRTLEWVGRHENLVICGPSGTGKTFMLEALGQAAVAAGKNVAWFSLEQLGALLRRHRADDSVTKAIARILRADLVVVDDIGLLPVGPDAAEGLYRLVDAAYERRSVAVSSNLHPSKAHMFAATCARWRLKRDMFGNVGTGASGGAGGCQCRRRPRDLRRRLDRRGPEAFWFWFPCLGGISFTGLESAGLSRSFFSLKSPGRSRFSLFLRSSIARSASPSANLAQNGLRAAIPKAAITASSFWAG